MQKSIVTIFSAFCLYLLTQAACRAKTPAAKQTPLQLHLDQKKLAQKRKFFNSKHTWDEEGLKGRVKTMITSKYICYDTSGTFVKTLDEQSFDSFSADGRSLKGTWARPDEKIDVTFLCLYDAQHRDTMNVNYNKDGTTGYLDKKKYDSRGRLLTWSFYHEFSNSYWTPYEYHYDDKDNLVFERSRQSTEMDSNFADETFTYYDFGLTKSRANMDYRSKYSFVEKYFYDAQ